ncbi:MAG TPA: hypothetical protein DCL54_17925 [Alphaproteobacteria bacterium]|nr:hypothetical protein [Alphaproteobacteria bacterium]
MKPDPALVLNQIGGRLLFEIGPALAPGYGQGSAGTMGVLLIMAAQECERAASLRVAENRALRAWLREAAEGFEAADLPEPSVDIQALDAEGARLKQALIQAQIRLEARLPDPAAQALLLRSYDLLAEASRRRRIHLPPF